MIDITWQISQRINQEFCLDFQLLQDKHQSAIPDMLGIHFELLRIYYKMNHPCLLVSWTTTESALSLLILTEQQGDYGGDGGENQGLMIIHVYTLTRQEKVTIII